MNRITVTYFLVYVFAIFVTSSEAIEEQHEFGSSTAAWCYCGTGGSKSWDSTARSTFGVKYLEIESYLAEPSGCPYGGTHYVKILINGSEVFSCPGQYVDDTSYKYYSCKGGVDFTLNEDDIITYHFSYVNTACIMGINQVTFFDVAPGAPEVTTNDPVSDITFTAATSGGDVTSAGSAAVTARGICWNTSANPTISNSKTTDGTGTGSFTSSITDLGPGTTYYVRAYATNSVGTSYGSNVNFRTTESILFVSSNGGCGANTPCYESIQDAIGDAISGSVILVKHGNYAESLSLGSNKTLLIKGGYNDAYDQQSPNTTFIQALRPTTINASSGSLKFQMINVK